MAIQKLEDIYTKYFQKSKVFLYPVLGHRRGTGVTPIDTYLEWGDYTVSDRKLICLYYLRDDNEFMVYEERHLLGNPYFEDYKEVADDKAIYIFNLDEYAEDYDQVINGNYSQVSQKLKNKIREIYGGSSSNYAFIKSYLYPEEHYDEYAMMLSPQPEYVQEMKLILEKTGELCSKPDLTRERLKMSVKSLKL